MAFRILSICGSSIAAGKVICVQIKFANTPQIPSGSLCDSPLSSLTWVMRFRRACCCRVLRNLFKPAPRSAIWSIFSSLRCLRCRRKAFHSRFDNTLCSTESYSCRLFLKSAVTSSLCSLRVRVHRAADLIAASMISDAGLQGALTKAASNVLWYLDGCPQSSSCGFHPTCTLRCILRSALCHRSLKVP